MWAELWTFLIATMPITELRVSIPVAIKAFHLSPEEAFFWAVLGNIFPNFFILKFLGPITNFLRKHFQFCEKFFSKLFEITHAKHSEKFEKVGAIFLIIFIAIPLPGTGSWSGSLIAWLFKVPYWKAMGLISLGVIGAGIIVTAGFTSIFKIMEILF